MTIGKKRENRLGFKKIILLAFLIVLLIAGVGYKLYMTTHSTLYTAASVVISLIGISILVILFLKLKNNAKYKFAIIATLVICISIIGMNLYYLNADYFIPHKSTSYHNRNAQYSLRSSFAIEEYLKDKTVYMDSENLYYDWDYKLSEYPTMLDIVTMNFTSKSIEVYPEKIDIMQTNDTEYLLSLDENDYVYIIREDNWNRDVYFYIGESYEQSDSIILLCDIHERMFFVTQDIYDDIKNLKEK